MTKPLGPGVNVVCTKAVSCPCECTKATQGAIYMCVDVGYRSFIHAMYCATEGCDATLIILKGKEHCLCACCFAPLDDGDTSLVLAEDQDPQVITEPEKIDA